MCINFQHTPNFSFHVVYLVFPRDSNATAKTTAQMVVMKLDVVSLFSITCIYSFILLRDLLNKGQFSLCIQISYMNVSLHIGLSDQERDIAPKKHCNSLELLN